MLTFEQYILEQPKPECTCSASRNYAIQSHSETCILGKWMVEAWDDYNKIRSEMSRSTQEERAYIVNNAH